MSEKSKDSAIQNNQTAPVWTPEQLDVIRLRDRSMLVSAAAGSGKTAVLVERIISMITDETRPVDIDQLLVVTFTNAAASEMRERVFKAIEKKLEEDPQNVHLQRQATLVHNAQITTIDSFCLHVIRNHFHRISLEPGFRIGDEGELKLLREDVCDKVLESFYESKDPRFLSFSDSYSTARSDAGIRGMILQLFDYSQSYPWPGEWLSACAKQYRAETEEELEQKPWVSDFLAYLHIRMEDMLAQYKAVYRYTLDEDGPQMYEETVRDDLGQMENLLSCRHLSQWREQLQQMEFKRLSAARKYAGSEDKKNAVTQMRDRVKKQIKTLEKDYFSVSPQRHLELLQKTSVMAETLVELTQAFAECYAREKAEKNILDFHDVEHFALNVLVDADTKLPTATAQEYQKQFREIMIDEYQDSNYVQEALLTAVSGILEGRENLFMVGDVKQSIYRFRLARPEIFMEKYNTFTLRTSEKDDSRKQRIDLHRNFRSRGEVIGIVNDIFGRIMGRDLGNVEYDAQSALYQGASFCDEKEGECYAPECITVEPDPYSNDDRMTEARVVAARIRELIDGGEIPGKQYRDVVILLRSLSGWAESFQKVFDQEGIPLIVSSRTGYFSAKEVQTVLAFLRVIDNPRQDIPLAAVMRSPIGGFSPAQLAKIRADCPDRPFYECVREKAGGFWDMLASFRKRVSYTPVHLLLQQILDETGYLNYVTALPGGEQRRANLDMLLEKAIAYEQTSYQGLFHFVRYIDRLMKYDVDYGEAEMLQEQENAVRLMTIHKSKGLEFPIVFVSGLGKKFNMTDSSGNMIFHPVYGFGLKWFDLERRTKSDTLIRKIFSIETKKENLGEELRVLYVALTRAKEKLILTGIRKGEEEAVSRIEEPYQKLDFTSRMDANCSWDWILKALNTYGEKYPVISRTFEDRAEREQKKRQGLMQERQELERQLQEVDSSLYEQLCSQLSREYPFDTETVLKQKVSVSEIKHRAMEEYRQLLEQNDREEMFAKEIPVPYVPDFIRKQEVNQGALRGTAVHRFLECLDFASFSCAESASEREMVSALETAADELVKNGRMSEEEKELLNMRKISRFLESPAAKRMMMSAKKGLLTKEQPFVMSVPAQRVWKECKTEELVLVQGIIDVFWEEEDGIVLLDYKTDRVDTPQELAGRYREQLLLYAEAIDRMFAGKKVKEILIYSFGLDQTIAL